MPPAARFVPLEQTRHSPWVERDGHPLRPVTHQTRTGARPPANVPEHYADAGTDGWPALVTLTDIPN